MSRDLSPEDIEDIAYGRSGSPTEPSPMTDAGRRLLAGPNMRRALLSDILAIEAEAIDAGREWAYAAALNVVREVHAECASIGTLEKMLERARAEARASSPQPDIDVEQLFEALSFLGEDDILADGSLWKIKEIALNAAAEYNRRSLPSEPPREHREGARL